MRRRIAVSLGVSVLLLAALSPGRGIVAQRPEQSAGRAPDATVLSGSSTTRLEDGRLLSLGGQPAGVAATTVSILDPATQVTTVLPVRTNQARAWHTATLLDDGTVLVL